MVRKCACRGCPNRQKPPPRRKRALPTPTVERIHFYSFPANDPERLKLWLLRVQRDVDLHPQIARLLTLCSEHFSPDDFRPGTGKIRRKLKKTAVPSLCLPKENPLQLSQDTKSEGCPHTPIQGAESESQESQAAATPSTSLLPVAAEKEGNREEFVTTILPGVPQSTPLKSYDRQSSVREAKDSVSEFRLVLSTPKSAKDPSRLSTSGTYYAMPVIKSFQYDELAQTEIKSEDQLRSEDQINSVSQIKLEHQYVAPALNNEDIIPESLTLAIKNKIKEESVATKLQPENRLQVSMDSVTSSDKISHSFVQTANPVTVERKVVVCKQRPQVPKETNLTGLFKTCIQCGKPVLEYTTVSSGNLNRLQWKCANGHLMCLFPNTNPT